MAGDKEQQEIDYLVKLVKKKLEFDEVETFKFIYINNPFKSPKPSLRTVGFYHDLYTNGDGYVKIKNTKDLLDNYLGVKNKVETNVYGIKSIVHNNDWAYDKIRVIHTIFGNRYTKLTMGEAMKHIAPVVLDRIREYECTDDKDHTNTAKRVAIQKILKTSKMHMINGYLVKLGSIITAKEVVTKENARVYKHNLNPNCKTMIKHEYSDRDYNLAIKDYSSNLVRLMDFLGKSAISTTVKYTYNEKNVQVATYMDSEGSYHIIDLINFSHEVGAPPITLFDINNDSIFLGLNLDELEFEDIEISIDDEL